MYELILLKCWLCPSWFYYFIFIKLQLISYNFKTILIHFFTFFSNYDLILVKMWKNVSFYSCKFIYLFSYLTFKHVTTFVSLAFLDLSFDRFTETFDMKKKKLKYEEIKEIQRRNSVSPHQVGHDVMVSFHMLSDADDLWGNRADLDVNPTGLQHSKP